ncbi:MAG: hypothetical protein NTX50_03200 [Candidatus Sumerlaeota bacterium]|nr:hypothetical protein [Candidatus Sumerlaeota bacterium]
MKRMTKTFDCIEMKRRIQERIYEETKDMDYAQLAEYYRKRIANSEFAFFLDRPASGIPAAARHG